jgi:nicotinamidase-related amidase
MPLSNQSVHVHAGLIRPIEQTQSHIRCDTWQGRTGKQLLGAWNPCHASQQTFVTSIATDVCHKHRNRRLSQALQQTFVTSIATNVCHKHCNKRLSQASQPTFVTSIATNVCHKHRNQRLSQASQQTFVTSIATNVCHKHRNKRLSQASQQTFVTSIATNVCHKHRNQRLSQALQQTFVLALRTILASVCFAWPYSLDIQNMHHRAALHLLYMQNIHRIPLGVALHLLHIQNYTSESASRGLRRGLLEKILTIVFFRGSAVAHRPEVGAPEAVGRR